MKVWPVLKFLGILLLTTALIWLLSTPRQMGDKSLPALGNFFNPFTGFWKNGEPLMASFKKDLHTALPGLQGNAEVVFDDLMVPHIFAENAEDAYMIQGFLAARDRLWQMDMTVRKTSGRLSEVLGARTLEVDRIARRRGMIFAAENNLVGWRKSPESWKRLEAYTAGVNAYVNSLSPAQYPVEFKLLGYEPEAWSVLKCALVIEAMAETLCAREDDLAATNTLAAFGRTVYDSLYPAWNPKQQPIIPDTGQWKNLHPFPTAASSTTVPPGSLSGFGSLEFDRLAAEEEELDPYHEGSNNWAVSGMRTRSGNTLLANDPHLSLTLPSIWYQVQIHTPQFNSYGVSLPGLPGIVIGFNKDIAWGMTNVGQDVSDWYQIKWSNPERTQYLVDGERKNATLRVEPIFVRGKETLYDTVRYTIWGPVVYDHQPKHPLRDCALRWISHDVPGTSLMEVLPKLSEAKNYADYRKDIAGHDSPAQNMVFASSSGDIAITVQGRFPVRAYEQGRFVQDGSKWANGWHNFIPEDQVPAMKNPSRGFVFSANQHSTPPSYPYYYLGDFEDYRSRRIFDRLQAMHGATVDSMKALQLDNFSQRAADALPLMLHLLDRDRLDGFGREIVGTLEKWNYNYEAQATAPVYFEMWFDSLAMKTWDEMAALRAQDKPIQFPKAWRLIDLLEKDTLNRFFDVTATPGRETAREVVNLAFKSMEAHFTNNPTASRNWGESRGFALMHLARLDPFSRLDLKVGGHKSAPNAINRTHGPSWRMVVEMGESVKGYGVYPGGQSGNPGSRYYDNLVDTWAAGKYYELLFLQSAAETSPRILGKQTFGAK